MADLFISYSRRDQPFVRRFAQALSDRGREVWVDWRDIPPTAPWMEEVRGAIAGADAFVFVISPDSVSSTVCRKEIEEAADYNKRFVPVLLRQVEHMEVPEPAASHNWISFEDLAAFDTAVEELVRALDIDIDWLHAHTRYLVRAREWDHSGRDKSFLLRGRDLQLAESWLGESAGKKDPEPTPLQAQYVVASQRAAARGQRTRFAALAAGFTVAVLLAIFALFQRNNAIRQANLAQSRELAADSLAQLQVDPEVSLLLAIQAGHEASTAQATDALRRALQESRVRETLTGSAIAYWTQYSPDGSHVLVAYADGTTRLWDLMTHKYVQYGDRADANEVYSARFDRNGDRFVTGTQSGAAVVWDTASASQVAALKLDDHSIFAASLDAGGERVVTGGDDGFVRMWEVSTGHLVRQWKVDTPRINDAEFSPNGDEVVAATNDGTAIVWDATTGTRLHVLTGHSGRVNTAAFSPDGGSIVTTSLDQTARIYDAGTGRFERSLAGHTDSVVSAFYSSNGTQIVTASHDHTARVWNALTGRSVMVLRGHAENVTAAGFSPEGSRVVTAAEDSTARVWDVAMGRPAPTFQMHSGPVLSARYSPDWTQVVTSGDDGKVLLWTAGGRFVKELLSIGTPASDAEFSPDGTRVAVAGNDGIARIVDLATGHVVELQGENGPLTSVAVWCPSDGCGSASARVVAAGRDRKVRVWGLTGHSEPQPLAHNSKVWDATFSPDGKWILTAAGDNKVRIWDASTGAAQIKPLQQGFEAVYAVSFDAKGIRVITAGEDRIARVWDLASRRMIETFAGHRDKLNDAEFSPDGTKVVTASADGTAAVWDVASGRLLEMLREQPGAVHTATFARNGIDVLVASDDETASVYACDLCGSDLLSVAESRVTRALTAVERQRFLHQ